MEQGLKQKKHITDYLLTQTQIRPADLCLVFGNRNAIDVLADKAADLYAQKYVPLIFATGGVRVSGGGPEALEVREKLIKRGVPRSKILTEIFSTNTQENIEQARRVLSASGRDKTVASVIGVGHFSASRRFLMTLRRRWPEVFPMFQGVNPYAVDAKDWDLCPEARATILQEYKKIKPYLQQGFLTEVDINDINRQVADWYKQRKITPSVQP